MPRVAPEPLPMVKLEDFQPSSIEEQIKYETNRALSRISILLQQYAAAMNNISLGDNIGEKITVEFAQAGTELTVNHNLNRLPKAIIGIQVDMPGVIYISQAASTSQLFLKSDTDSLSGSIYIA